MLQRQLKKLNFSAEAPPANAQQWQDFLKLIDITYTEYENHLYRSHNTLNVATDELQRLYTELEAKSSQQIQSLDSKLQNIMSTAPCIIMWIDNQMIIEGCNSYFRQLMKIHEPLEGRKITFADLNLQHMQDKSREFIRSTQNQMSFITQIKDLYLNFWFRCD